MKNILEVGGEHGCSPPHRQECRQEWVAGMEALIQHADVEESNRNQHNHRKEVIRPIDLFEPLVQPLVEPLHRILEKNREKSLNQKH